MDITLHHIYGHQEDNTPYENLEFESQLNVDCDGEAKRQMRASSISGHTEAEPGTGAMLYLEDDMITSHMAEQIQYAGQAPKMFHYIREWKMRNTILHSPDSFLLASEMSINETRHNFWHTRTTI